MAWERPKTIKLYLQPPACDRLITLWPDLKIVDQAATAPPDSPQDCFGVHLLFGPSAQAVSWEETRFRVRGDGIPVHGARARWEDFRIELECFCGWDAPRPDGAPSGHPLLRPPVPMQSGAVTYVKLTVSNEAAQGRDFLLGLLPRTTEKEYYLWGIRSDFYASYRPQVATWDWVPNTWTAEEATLRDGDRALAWVAPEGTVATWRERAPVGHGAHYYLELTTRIPARESRVFYLALGPAEPVLGGAAAYEARQAQTVARWEQELAAVRRVPGAGEGEIREIYWSLIGQCLQMLALDHEGLLRPRQGGGCPHVWPWEAVEFLTALDRVGLGHWVRETYEFFRRHQMTEGPDRGRYAAVGAPNWYGHTGAVLRGLGDRLVREGSEAYFAGWRESALAAVEWIEGLRAKTKTKRRKLGWGLMAPGPGHDWEIPAQYWCFTDVSSYRGLREIARAFAHFGDPEAGRLQAAADEYEACLKRTLEQVIKGQEEREDVYIPNLLGAEESWPPRGPYFADGPVNLIQAGILDPHSDLFERLEKYFQNHGWMQNGLTGLMTDGLFSWSSFFTDPWAGHTWYTSFSDMGWFYGWLARGERTKAVRTLRAQFLYGMTSEYYMQERFADNDPTFCPWQPNASANGRTLMMILDFYGEEER
jgi:hypothetical protein